MPKRSTSIPRTRHVSSTRARAGEHHLVVADTRRRLLVDGNNVIGSRPDGWWRDRPAAARRLVGELRTFARRTGEPLTVVFDGRPLAGLGEGEHDGVRVAYARRGGRDGGDDRIVEEVENDADPTSLTVVTSDRALADRVRALGATVQGAGAPHSRVGIGTPLTPSSRSTPNVFSAIDTRWYWPTVKTTSSSPCAS